jgi:hypothetical protein
MLDNYGQGKLRVRPAHDKATIERICREHGGWRIATWRSNFRTPAAAWSALQSHSSLVDHVAFLLNNKGKLAAMLLAPWSAKFRDEKELATAIEMLSRSGDCKAMKLNETIYPETVTILVEFGEQNVSSN